MTLQEILERLRIGFLDDGVNPQLWSDRELVQYLNTTNDDLVGECSPILDATTISDANGLNVCNIPFTQPAVPTTPVTYLTEYALHPSLIRLTSVSLASSGKVLPFKDFHQLIIEHPTWRVDTGEPQFWMQLNSDKLMVYPTPITADSLNLIMYRYQLLPFDETDLMMQPEWTPERFHDTLLDGVLSLAYLKQDAETFDVKQSQTHQTLYTQGKESLKRFMIRRDYTNDVASPLYGNI